jgi:putative alpha-1,2-mannosidase
LGYGCQQTAYASTFSHYKEVAKPGYYSVELDRYNVTAELTATSRAALHRYRFPESKEAGFIVDLDYSLQGQENIDMKQEEEKKTAEEAADKKKELEEKLQARKDEKNEQEELTKNIVEAANKQAGGTDSVVQAQQEIKDMMNKLKLVEDDVKGAAVDQGI